MKKDTRRDEEGFMLIAMVVAIFLILLVLSVAAARVSMQLKREREVETQHRANEYVRAIRLYYRKFPGQYPPSIEALKKTNNQRFLRQEYIDPLTGEKDWRLIRVGQNKTTVKGFFGEDLPGLPGGLGAAAGLASGSSGGSAFGNSGSAFGGSSSPTTTGTPASATTGAGSSTGGSGSAFGSGSGSGFGSGSGSQGTDSLNGGVGPFIGVGVGKSGESILTVNGQDHYEDWEFLYDPRIEQMYAKASLLGGGISSGSAGSLGSAGGLSSGFGNSSGSGASGNGNTGNPSSGTPTTPPASSPP